MTRKEQFKRPEPGFSLYEGRTRGKKMKYTYSDDEDVFNTDSTTTRRSTRNTGTHTPAETGPVTTASGRQIRAPTRLNPTTGSSAPGSVQGDALELENEDPAEPSGRSRRSAAAKSGWSGASNVSRHDSTDGSENESEAEFGDDEEDIDEHVPGESEDEDDFDEDEAMVEDDLNDSNRSLVVKLSVTPPKLRTVLGSNKTQVGNLLPTPNPESGVEDVEKADAPMLDAPAAQLTPTKLTTAAVTSGDRHSPEQDPEAVERKNSTPSALHATPLAFRGSPEKSHVQPVPRPFSVGTDQD